MPALSLLRRPFSGRLPAVVLGTLWLSSGCGHDWDAYDPRQGTQPSTGSGGASSGTSSSSMSSGSGASGGGSSSSGAGGTASTSSSGAGEPCTPKQARGCYTGPVGSEDIGPCKGGYQVCNDEGTNWGPCQDQVLPVSEDCATAADDDCNGAVNNHCALWAKLYGGAARQQPRGVALDGSSGHMVIVAQTLGDVPFAGSTLHHAGGGDILVLKVDATGAPLWGKIFGDAKMQDIERVAVDAAGNIFLVGTFEGTLSFGAASELKFTDIGYGNMFVAKLDSSGNTLWARAFGNEWRQGGYALAVDEKGDVYLGGEFQGTLDFGLGTKVGTYDDKSDGVILKLDGKSGASLWRRTFGHIGWDWVDSLAVDSSGDLIVHGGYTTMAVFGPTALTARGENNVFIGKLKAADGSPLWFRGYGLGKDDFLSNVAVDGAGNIFAAGSIGTSIDFGCGAVTNHGPGDLLLVKLDASGKCLWNKAFGDPMLPQQRPSVATDGSGNVLVTAAFSGNVDFGGGVLSEAWHDILVLKLDTSGKLVWGRNFGDDDMQSGKNIVADGAGNVYVLGMMKGTTDFGGIELTSSDAEDLCLARLGP